MQSRRLACCDRDGKNKDGKNKDGKNKDGKNNDGKNKDGKNKDGKNNDGKNKDGKNMFILADLYFTLISGSWRLIYVCSESFPIIFQKLKKK